mmetsp:Transcript_83992/g.271816  ORF Transcript_83992/g.271816 Transcript_83992/m.271816 type:complete len:247 (+) Transcript_83992:195-935(+)
MFTLVQRCIVCICAASLTSARPPCSQEERLCIRTWASCSSRSSAGLILVCFFDDLRRSSVEDSSFWAASNWPWSLHAEASFSARVTSTRSRWAVTSSSGSSSGCGSSQSSVAMATVGVCRATPRWRSVYCKDASSSTAWALAASTGVASSTRTSRRSPAKMSGMVTVACVSDVLCTANGVCTAFRGARHARLSSTFCATTLARPPTAPAKASRMCSTSSTNVNGVLACSAISDSRAASWSAPKPKG